MTRSEEYYRMDAPQSIQSTVGAVRKLIYKDTQSGLHNSLYFMFSTSELCQTKQTTTQIDNQEEELDYHWDRVPAKMADLIKARDAEAILRGIRSCLTQGVGGGA